jgi:hypothetical protein
MIFLVIGLIFLVKERKYIILIPIFSIIFFILVSKTDLRLRYLLPAYPYLALTTSLGAVKVWEKYKNIRLVSIIFCIWFLTALFASFPHSISYTNELTKLFGKPYLVLSDSNIDWGQGLISLSVFSKKQNIGIVNLSYYGSDDPNQYGFSGYLYENICKKNCTLEKTYINKEGQQKEITAISITNWQECGFYRELYPREKIRDIIGGSILIFLDSSNSQASAVRYSKIEISRGERNVFVDWKKGNSAKAD